MSRVVVGLGSNLGDRAAHLRAAVCGLAEAGTVTAVSDVFETAPVGGPDQSDYLNCVVVMDSEWSARQLLGLGQRLEADRERIRTVRWGPRTLDVDLLWIDGVEMDEPDLVVPHPRMFERDFVLVPLAEVAADLLPERWEGPGAGEVRWVGPLTSVE